MLNKKINLPKIDKIIYPLISIIGFLYLIPFYSIIGNYGGFIYSAGYTLYNIFFAVLVSGLSFAFEKILTSYQTLGYHDLANQVKYKSRQNLIIVSVISFLIIYFMASIFAKVLSSDAVIIQDLTIIFKSFAIIILIAPNLMLAKVIDNLKNSENKHHISTKLEKAIKVFLILILSFFTVKVFEKPLVFGVVLAILGIFISNFVTYIYLLINEREIFYKKINANNFDQKSFYKKLLFYAFPYVLMELSLNMHQLINLFQGYPALTNQFNYSSESAMQIVSSLNFWGHKISALIPFLILLLSSDLINMINIKFSNNDYKALGFQFLKTLKIISIIILPITILLSLLAKPIWNLMYASQELGALVFSNSVFVSLFGGMFILSILVLLNFKKYRILVFSIITSIVLKLLFQSPLMSAYNFFGFDAFYGMILASNLAYIIPFSLNLWYLNNALKIDYSKSFDYFLEVLILNVLFVAVIVFLSFLIPFEVISRITSLGIVIIVTLISLGLYFVMIYVKKMIPKALGIKKEGEFFNALKKY